MVYSWMGEDYAWLRPLQETAQLLAQKADWPKLYDTAAIGSSGARVAALVSYEVRGAKLCTAMTRLAHGH